MTAIAGITDGTTCWLAGDSAVVSGYDLTVRPEPKVFARGPYLFGLTGSGRASQLLRYTFQPPDPAGDLLEHMCTTFVSALRTCLKDAGWAKKTDEKENADAHFLAAVSGRVFKVWADYQVTEREDGYDAVGCGEDLLLGSLHTTAALGWAPEARLAVALEAAARFSTGVCPPFTVVRTPPAEAGEAAA